MDSSKNSAQSSPSSTTLPHAPLLHLNLIARSLVGSGIDLDEVFAESDLELPDTNNPISRISLYEVSDILEWVFNETKDPIAGMKIYENMRLADLSAMGFALSCSTSYHSFLERGHQYLRYFTSVGSFTILEEDEYLFLMVELPDIYDSSLIKHQRVAECMGCAFITLSQEVTHQKSPFLSIYLNRVSHPSVKTYLESIAHCTIEVDSPMIGFKICKSRASATLPMANPEMACVNDELVLQHFRQIYKNDFVYQVESLISEGLGKEEISKTSIATQLACSERKLHQKLAEQGTSFSKLHNKIRKKRAMQLVKAGTLNHNQIAYALGLTNPSNFARSFNAWTGYTLNEFKAL